MRTEEEIVKEIQDMWVKPYPGVKLGTLGNIVYNNQEGLFWLTILCNNGDARCNSRVIQIESMLKVDKFISDISVAHNILENIKDVQDRNSNLPERIRLNKYIYISRYGGVEIAMQDYEIQQNPCFSHYIRTKEEIEEILFIWKRVKLTWIDAIMTHPHIAGQLANSDLKTLLSCVNKEY